ncbi:crotonase/enoyl-CoA hydratase family protein [Rhodococcus opacus]|uniref:crotonase/enoyl-CoA hydratase family protein n=1 Tax=Rhodococcus opacus TaxID=37919 RepID=UPI000EA9D2A9|nr:crotonase/enoyl-CoA hydratase family protein [Rhodococcus opacus]QZS56991.1 crotonase/enoyl-CoA hydratase family protein [Rhodococcus opacus]RKM76386.1 enoyl-CoA hydratase [Rhodococcus opacus]
MSSTVAFEVVEGTAVVTLNRPESRNAIDKATADAIAAALDEVDQRTDIAVCVLAAVGDVFSAGMDLKAFSATGERPLTKDRGAFGIVTRPPTKPIIAAVEGKALGGGFELALVCDLIVASDNAQFGLPEVKRGLVAAAGGVLRLPRKLPSAIAMELALTGEPIGADRAAALGLVNRVVPAGDALNTALAMASTIAKNAPIAVRTAKLLIDRSTEWNLSEAFVNQAPYTDAVRNSNDAAEGARAFVEKRAPAWTNT